MSKYDNLSMESDEQSDGQSYQLDLTPVEDDVSRRKGLLFLNLSGCQIVLKIFLVMKKKLKSLFNLIGWNTGTFSIFKLVTSLIQASQMLLFNAFIQVSQMLSGVGLALAARQIEVIRVWVLVGIRFKQKNCPAASTDP